MNSQKVPDNYTPRKQRTAEQNAERYQQRKLYYQNYYNLNKEKIIKRSLNYFDRKLTIRCPFCKTTMLQSSKKAHELTNKHNMNLMKSRN